MKKIFTLLTVLTFFAGTALKAQLAAHYSSTHVTGENTDLVESHAVIVNTASTGPQIIVKVQRVNTLLAPGHMTYFCWGNLPYGQCYNPSASYSPFITPDTVMLGPGDSTTAFIAYALPNGTNGTNTVSYTFYDVANPATNKVQLDYTYDFATGINDLNASGAYLNCTQSNTEGLTRVSYSVSSFRDAKVVVRNLLGSVVKEVKLTDKQGVVNVSTSDMPSGIYMYFLYNGNNPVASKKMVISR